MGKIQMAKMVTAHFQFLGLLAKLNFQFPNVFKDFIDFSGLINLNLDFLFDWLEIPRIDHRVMFILVAIGVPLGLMILTALVFYSIQAILQFSCVVVAVLVLLAFILRMAAPQWIPRAAQAEAASVTQGRSGPARRRGRRGERRVPGHPARRPRG